MQYTLEYCEVVQRAYENGFVNKKIQTFINKDFLGEIQRRIKENDTTPDKFGQAIHVLHDEMCMIKDYRKRVERYLQKLGLNNKPYEVLYTKKVEIPAKKYVCLTKLYEDDSWTYEEFYGSGKSQTVDEFIQEFEDLYKGTGVEIRGCDGPFTDPPCTQYYYNGIYTISKGGE